MSHRHRAPLLRAFWLRHRASSGFRISVLAAVALVVLGASIGVLLTGQDTPGSRAPDGGMSVRAGDAPTAPEVTLADPPGSDPGPVGPTVGPVAGHAAPPGSSAQAPSATAAASGGGGTWSSPEPGASPSSAPVVAGSGPADTGGTVPTRSAADNPHSAAASVPIGHSSGSKPSGSGSKPSRPSPSSLSPTSPPSPSQGPSKGPSDPPPTQSDPTPSQPVDRTAPQTSAWTVSSGVHTWVVGVDADEPASYSCSLDGGGYAPCSATISYSGLHPGWHTFVARATDESGNTDPTPAVLRVRLKGQGNGGG